MGAEGAKPNKMLAKYELSTWQYVEAATITNYSKRVPALKFQNPLNPAESHKLVQIPADFKFKLYVAEPEQAVPSYMDKKMAGIFKVYELAMNNGVIVLLPTIEYLNVSEIAALSSTVKLNYLQKNPLLKEGIEFYILKNY